MNMKRILSSLYLVSTFFIYTSTTDAKPICMGLFGNSNPAFPFHLQRAEIDFLKFNMPGLEVAAVSDPTLATGSTLFYFPKGAAAQANASGGSVAAIETTLLDHGSYSNIIDGIVFSGGSTMGLAAHGGVRAEIFNERSDNAGDFDFIPSVPGAVVYDFGQRLEETQNQKVYPTEEMGRALFNSRSPNLMPIGRIGAGTSTTANKISKPIWGGQGAAFKSFRWGKIFVAVALNPVGNVQFSNIDTDRALLQPLRDRNGLNKIKAGHNTTLSIVITDLKLDRNQLQRLANSVHTNMAKFISPFQTYTDGDILFAVSLGTREFDSNLTHDDIENYEFQLMQHSINLMGQAIYNGVQVANKL